MSFANIDRHIIGVISDTHGLIRSEALEILKKSELIIHAGDIGKPDVLEKLRTIARTVAVRGNTDKGEWAQSLPKFEIIEFEHIFIYVIHDFKEFDIDPVTAGFSAIISGHSHQPSIRSHKGVLLLNPGSAGPRRFNLPVSVALIYVKDRILEPQIIELKVGTSSKS